MFLLQPSLGVLLPHQKLIGRVMEIVTAFFKQHQMRAIPNLYVLFEGRGLCCGEKPSHVVFGTPAVPFPSDYT
jgi:hypothetical protein